MRTLKQLLEKSNGYEPKPKDEKRFVDKHVIVKHDDANGNKDDVFNASNVKEVDREKEGHGYKSGQDEAVYEDKKPLSLATILEKKLTPAEMKKREEVAKAMERENPGMDKSKKMAIATATAKRVAEQKEQLAEGEVANAQYHQYHHEAKKMLEKIAKGLDTHSKHISNKDNYNGGMAHWGHVDEMKNIHRTIQDLHDRVLQQGEYAAPPKVKLKEDVEVQAEDAVVEFLNDFYSQLDDDNKKVFEELAQEQDLEQMLAIIDEVLNGEDSGSNKANSI